MCFSSPNIPDPPPPPQLQKPAELEAGAGLKKKDERRTQMLIKKRRSITGSAPTSGSV